MRNASVRHLAVMTLAVVAVAAPLHHAQEPVADGPPYEMDTYQVVFLKKGPKWTAERSPEVERIQAGHMANMRSLADAGSLIGAGPFLDDGELRGLFIFKVASADEARRLSSTDPAVQAGRFVVEVYGWWGPKGVGEPYKQRMKADPASKPQMRTFQLVILRKGPAWTDGDSPELRQLQRRHLGHIVALTREGVMPAAGPLEPPADWRGLSIYALGSVEEARARAEADPAVRSGHMAVDVHPLMMDVGVLPTLK